jgi:hypothetical protein
VGLVSRNHGKGSRIAGWHSQRSQGVGLVLIIESLDGVLDSGHTQSHCL